jgi:hypothetical protein
VFGLCYAFRFRQHVGNFALVVGLGLLGFVGVLE